MVTRRERVALSSLASARDFPLAWYTGSVKTWNCAGRVSRKIMTGRTTSAHPPRYPIQRSTPRRRSQARRAPASRISVCPAPGAVPCSGHTPVATE